MPEETVGQYEVEYEAAPLGDVPGWGAYVTVYGPSANPMHRNTVFSRHRVLLETVFDDPAEAERQARLAALELLHKT